MVGFHIFPYPTRAGLSLIQSSPSFLNDPMKFYMCARTFGSGPAIAHRHFVSCTKPSLHLHVPSHIDKLVMHKNRLSLVRPRRRGVPSAHPIGYTYKVSKARTPHDGRAFAHPMHFKCRNALSNTESVSRSVQILDLYPRLASITIIDFDKKSEIFCHM